jgi:hypothetical protein
VLVNLGDLELSRGELAAARRHLVEARRLAQAVGAWRQAGLARLNLGLVEEAAGEPVSAAGHHDAAVTVFEDVGERRLAAVARSHRGAARVAAGDLEGRVDCVESEQALQALGDRLQVGLAAVRVGWTDPAASAPALDRAERALRALGLGPESELGVAVARLRDHQGP